jgi:hypothetical protein
MSNPRHNGVALGPSSPLLTRAGALRRLQPSEADHQKQLMELLVGPALPGERRIAGAGMTGRFPELALIYAINPNKGGQNQTAARGMAKAMGQLQDMPDFHLPVMRGPFIGLYVELKVPGRYGTKAQRAIADALRAEGHCVLELQGVQEALNAIIGYLTLPLNRPSVRPIANEKFFGKTTLVERLADWRRRCHTMLAPLRPRRPAGVTGA